MSRGRPGLSLKEEKTERIMTTSECFNKVMHWQEVEQVPADVSLESYL